MAFLLSSTPLFNSLPALSFFFPLAPLLPALGKLLFLLQGEPHLPAIRSERRCLVFWVALSQRLDARRIGVVCRLSASSSQWPPKTKASRKGVSFNLWPAASAAGSLLVRRPNPLAASVLTTGTEVLSGPPLRPVHSSAARRWVRT